MTTRPFPIVTLLAILGEDEGKIVCNRITGTGRWSIDHELVFEYENTLYQTSYSVGATEMQNEGPWEYARDPVECVEVEAYEKIVIDYRPVQ